MSVAEAQAHPGYAQSPTYAPSRLARSSLPVQRLRHFDLSNADRNYAIAIHLSPYAWMIGFGPLALLIPLILWLVRKDTSVFADDHGREVMNFMLSFFLLHLVLLITIFGVVLMPVLWIVAIVSTIRAAIAAGNSEYFRYPVTFRFL